MRLILGLIFLLTSACTVHTPIISCKTKPPIPTYIVRPNPYYVPKKGQTVDKEHIFFVSISGQCE